MRLAQARRNLERLRSVGDFGELRMDSLSK
jgi:hypothetical protein